MKKRLHKYAFCAFLTSFSVLSAFGQAPPNGDCGTVLNFDGTNDFVQLDKVSTFGNSSATIEVWVKVPEIGSGGLTANTRVGNIFSNYDTPTSVNFEIHNRGEVRFYWKRGEVDQRGTKDLRDNKWHHIAYVRDLDSSRTTVYVDGEVEFTAAVGSNVTFSVPHRIGADNRSTTGGVPFHGAIDELKVWSIAKTQADIINTMNSMSTGSEANLLSYYDFNDGERSSLLLDKASGENSGHLTNMDTIADWTKPDGSEHPRTFASFTETSCGNYNWNGVSLTSTGVYDQVISNAAGCDSIMTLDLTINDMPDNTVSVDGAELTSNAIGVNYLWIDCNNNNVSLADSGQTFKASSNGDFAVVVSSGVCMDSSDCIPVIITGSNNAFSETQVELYPNPTSGSFKIQLDNVYSGVSVNVIDMTGVSVKTESFTTTNNVEFDFNGDAGIYLVEINTGSGLNKHVKLVVK